jgi:hypothetical protein
MSAVRITHSHTHNCSDEICQQQATEIIESEMGEAKM